MSNPKGNYYIRARTTGWYLWHQEWSDGKRKQERVDDKAFRDLGFRKEWSVDQAKSHVVQLNKEGSLIKEKIRKAAKRVTSLTILNETLFPQARVEEFQQVLEDENFGSSEHLRKINSQFLFVQRMCNELRILPVEYRQSQKRIYKHFMKRKISTSYAARLIALLNRWGRFSSKRSGNYYEDVDAPRGREKSAIADEQVTKRGKDTDLGVRTVSRPLTPALLEKCRENLSEENYNWLKISVWFGLRPEEVDCLKNEKRFRVDWKGPRSVQVLHVYQTKLQSIASNKRWKAIPIVYLEQVECLQIIASGKFKRPIYKTMRKQVGGGVTLYGGRKGFVDLMLDKGQRLEDISLWLGHKDISTTWQHYKNRDLIAFTPTEFTKRK